MYIITIIFISLFFLSVQRLPLRPGAAVARPRPQLLPAAGGGWRGALGTERRAEQRQEALRQRERDDLRREEEKQKGSKRNIDIIYIKWVLYYIML